MEIDKDVIARQTRKSLLVDATNNAHFQKNALIKFYKYVAKQTPKGYLSKKRIAALDKIVASWENYFAPLENYKYKMHAVAEKLTTSSRSMGLLNATEMKYFYIKIVDPEFLFLQMSEIAKDQEELKQLCLVKFRIYDSYIIHIEKQINSLLFALNENLTKN